MSDDHKNSEPFDFDFDANESQKSTGESSFDLDNPFGDDWAAPGGGASAPVSTGESSFDLGDPLGDDLATGDFSADNSEKESGETGGHAPISLEKPDKKKKGIGGWLSKGKDKSAKEKKEKTTEEPKPKKEKVIKEKTSSGEPVPRDWGTILCIAFSVFLLVSLLMFNIAGFLTRGASLMQTLCFLGAIDIIGLAAASVPILFYKFPQERTLPNVMLGIAAVAMFSTLLFAVTEFYRYGFIMTP